MKEVETNDGQHIVIQDENLWKPPVGGGLYGPDELRDIADALEGDFRSDFGDDEDSPE